jgi:hypothetical protein
MEEENKDSFNGKIKCLSCGEDNYSKEEDKRSPLDCSFVYPKLVELSEKCGLEYKLTICPNCIIGFFLGTMAVLTGENAIKKTIDKDIGHEIISNSFRRATSQFFTETDQMRKNLSLGREIIPES